jgi:uncharacterized protein YcfJ
VIAAHLLGALAGGCVYRGQQVGVGPAAGGAAVGVGAVRGWATKEVVDKLAPTTLLARDATRCEVSPERFGATAVGARVYCEWR